VVELSESSSRGAVRRGPKGVAEAEGCAGGGARRRGHHRRARRQISADGGDGAKDPS
jgi:hypothetical protein